MGNWNLGEKKEPSRGGSLMFCKNVLISSIRFVIIELNGNINSFLLFVNYLLIKLFLFFIFIYYFYCLFFI